MWKFPEALSDEGKNEMISVQSRLGLRGKAFFAQKTNLSTSINTIQTGLQIRSSRGCGQSPLKPVGTSSPPTLCPAAAVYLRLAQAIQIRDVEGVPGGGCVHAAGASFLQPQVLQDLVETRVLKSRAWWRCGFSNAASAQVNVRVRQASRYPGEKGQLDVHTGPEPGAQVGGAGEDVAKALVPHELPATLLNELLHLVTSQVTRGKLVTCR